MHNINEVETNDINLKPFKPKNKLHPDFFDEDGMLKSQIRMKLLDIVDDFVKSLEVKWVKPVDILLIGSIVNYNWSDFSDLDINIVYDFSKVYSKTDFVEDYFYARRNDWNSKHEELKIKGLPVELTVIDKNNPGQATGVYSLEKNKWIKEPKHLNDVSLNKEYIKRFCAKEMTKIDDLCDKMDSEKDSKKIETIANKLEAEEKKLFDIRKKGLATKEKEMATGNIIYKVIKHAGYIQKIRDYVIKAYDKRNTIKEHKIIRLTMEQKNRIENRPVAYLMVGIPGSGKSTWVKENLSDDVAIVSRDYIRAKLGYTKGVDDKAVLDGEKEKKVTEYQRALIHKCGNEGKSIVIDDMNISKRRKSMINDLKSNGFKIIAVHMNTPFDTCVKRREGQISPEVMSDIYKRMVELSPDEVDDIIEVDDNTDK